MNVAKNQISSTNLCFGHPGVTVLVIEAEYDLDNDKTIRREDMLTGGRVQWKGTS